MENSSIIPTPQCAVSVRPGTLADLPFIDELQKANSKNLGFLREKALEGKIAAGHVIIAQDEQNAPLGYCIGNDRYMKREDVGIIYQLNVAPGARRKLIGATLIQALFARSAYGCRLFCCWCAQDIEANRFWEALGFIPLAFRAGSASKGRVHIFWQRRIREGDTTTPWWFPSQTSAGLIGENRLVLPIPLGTHWSDAKPIILPTAGLPGQTAPALPAPRERVKKPKVVEKRNAVSRNGMWYDVPVPGSPIAVEKPKREKKPKLKNDPAHVAAVRELRDRYLEQFNEGTVSHGGKYDVSRQIESRPNAAAPALLGNALAA